MKRKMKLSLAIMMVALLTLAAVAPSFAASYTVKAATGKVEVTAGNLNVRSGPGTNYSVVSSLKKGDVLERTGTSGSWTRVKLSSGTEAFVFTKYVKVVTASGQYASTTNLRVRSGPSTKYSQIGSLKKGEVVTVVSVSKTWAKIKWGDNKDGYASFTYLTPVSDSGSSTETNPNGYLYAKTALNVFASPSVNSTVLGTVPAGTRVNKIGNSGVYAIIAWSGNGGYAYVTDKNLQVSSSGIGNTKVTMYASIKLNVYSAATTSSTVLGTISKGTPVVQVGTQGVYAIIEWGTNTYGYVSAQYLQATKPSDGGSSLDNGYMYVTTRSIAYSGAGTQYAVLGTIPQGEIVNKLATYGDYALIEWGGINGYAYMLNANLTPTGTSNVGNPNSGVVAAELGIKKFMNDNLLNADYKFYLESGFYSLNVPYSYDMSSYNFTKDSKLDIVYSYGSSRIYFTWYRAQNGQELLNASTVGWESYTSNGNRLFYKANTAAGYVEIYWVYSGDCFYARFPNSFSSSDVGNICALRFTRI